MGALFIIPIIFWVLFWVIAAVHFYDEKDNVKAAAVCLFIAGPHGWLIALGAFAFWLVNKIFK